MDFPKAPSGPGPPPRVSEAVAVPVAEGRLGELHDAQPGPVEELGGAPQHPLGLGERVGQLLLPLHKLGVTLHGNTQRGRDSTLHCATRVGAAGGGQWPRPSRAPPAHSTPLPHGGGPAGGPCGGGNGTRAPRTILAQPHRDRGAGVGPEITRALWFPKQLKSERSQLRSCDGFNTSSQVVMR